LAFKALTSPKLVAFVESQYELSKNSSNGEGESVIFPKELIGHGILRFAHPLVTEALLRFATVFLCSKEKPDDPRKTEEEGNEHGDDGAVEGEDEDDVEDDEMEEEEAQEEEEEEEDEETESAESTAERGKVCLYFIGIGVLRAIIERTELYALPAKEIKEISDVKALPNTDMRLHTEFDELLDQERISALVNSTIFLKGVTSNQAFQVFLAKFAQNHNDGDLEAEDYPARLGHVLIALMDRFTESNDPDPYFHSYYAFAGLVASFPQEHRDLLFRGIVSRGIDFGAQAQLFPAGIEMTDEEQVMLFIMIAASRLRGHLDAFNVCLDVMINYSTTYDTWRTFFLSQCSMVILLCMKDLLDAIKQGTKYDQKLLRLAFSRGSVLHVIILNGSGFKPLCLGVGPKLDLAMLHNFIHGNLKEISGLLLSAADLAPLMEGKTLHQLFQSLLFSYISYANVAEMKEFKESFGIYEAVLVIVSSMLGEKIASDLKDTIRQLMMRLVEDQLQHKAPPDRILFYNEFLANF